MMSIFKSDWDRIGGRFMVFGYVLGSVGRGGQKSRNQSHQISNAKTPVAQSSTQFCMI